MFIHLSPLFVLCTVSLGADTFDYNQYESPAKPAPAWVHRVDLGDRNPELKGYRAPAGVKVEVVAREPDVINPVAFRFGDDGTLHRRRCESDDEA